LLAFHRHRSEYPIRFPIVGTSEFQLQKRLGNSRIERYVFGGSFRFGRSGDHHDERTANVNYEILEIHILPLQTDQFSPTKSSKRVELRAAVRRGSGNFSNNAVISYESVHPVLATAWHFDVLS